MEWQPVLNLVVPLISALTVVYITTRSNVRLKKLDVEQRKADHDQEFRKLYATKRIEAAEQYVDRLVAIIDKFDILRSGLLTADFDEESDNAYSAKLMEKSEALQTAADAVSSKTLSTAYLYFDDEVLEQKTDAIAPRLILAEKQLVDVVNEKRRIWQLFHEPDIDAQSKRNVGAAYHEKEAELTKALENYNQCILDYRSYLVGICSAIRKDLAKLWIR